MTVFLKIQELEKLRRFSKMEIEVRVDNEVVFNGLAEDFLFMKDCDMELETVLNEMEIMKDGSIINYDGMEIEKLESLIWD